MRFHHEDAGANSQSALPSGEPTIRVCDTLQSELVDGARDLCLDSFASLFGTAVRLVLSITKDQIHIIHSFPSILCHLFRL